MHAVIMTGGKQYLVTEGQSLKVEKLGAEAGTDVTFDQVLLVTKGDGEDVQIGTPFLEGARVTAIVEEEGRDKKIRVTKYKPKIRYKKVFGHRQHFTKVTIKEIKA